MNALDMAAIYEMALQPHNLSPNTLSVYRCER